MGEKRKGRMANNEKYVVIFLKKNFEIKDSLFRFRPSKNEKKANSSIVKIASKEDVS